MFKLSAISILTLSTACVLTGCTQSRAHNPASASISRPVSRSAVKQPQYLHVKLPTDAQKAIGITYAAATERPLEFVVRATGEVLANSNCLARVNSPVTGRATDIKVSVGDHVHQGQVLLSVRSNDIEQSQADLLQNEAQVRSDLKRELLQIDSEINQTKAQIKLSESTFQRMSSLVEEKIASKADFERAKTAFDKDIIELQTLTNKRAATITLSQERMKLMTEPIKQKLHIYGASEIQIHKLLQTREIDPVVAIVAPEAGVVSERNVNLGELVDPSKILFTVTDSHSVWLKADVFEKDIEKIELGDPIELEVDSFPGQKFRGKLNYLADSVNPDSRTLTVRAEVANPNNKLKPKMFARMNILVGEHRVLSIPKTAVQDAGSSKVVYVPKSPEEFEERKVELGNEANGFIEVLRGLKQGERVVTRGCFELRSESYHQSD